MLFDKSNIPSSKAEEPTAPPQFSARQPSKGTGLPSQPSSETPARVTESSETRNLPQQEIGSRAIFKPIGNVAGEDGLSSISVASEEAPAETISTLPTKRNIPPSELSANP